MNAVDADLEHAVNSLTEENARVVMSVLREYGEKISSLSKAIAALLEKTTKDKTVSVDEAAWLLDQSELTRKPFLTMLSRGSGLREHSSLEPITRDELNIRMTEVEVHLHHMIRRTGELRATVDRHKKTDEVAKLRLTAGLNAMRGGPLHPD